MVFHVIVVLLFLRAARLYPERHDFALRYAIGFSLAASVWLGSLAVPEEMRPWIWAAALLIDLVNPAVAVQSVRGMTYDVSHIPERYGLFTLIVLGEAIIAVARGTSEAEWNPAAVTAALAGFVLAVVIWMAYFAHPHAELLERGRLAAFVWGYGHIFVWAGIAITGVGIELAIEAAEAGHGFPLAERLILCGGPALYVASMALLRAAGAGHITDRVVLIRLGTAIVSLVVGFLGGGLAPELFTVIVAAIAIAAGLAISAVWRTAPAATT